MKKIVTLQFFIAIVINSFSQQQVFDITNYTAPAGWKKQATESALQLSKEDTKTGAYCIITLLKSLPGKTDPKVNFDDAWTSVVKEMVEVAAAPEMQAPSTEDGWQIRSGYAPFTSESQKGIALLVTATGYGKMVNLLILTNTDVYEKDMTTFLEGLSFKKQTQTTKTSPPVIQKNTQQLTAAKKDGFTFTTSNFDDGWTSIVQEDWVQATKGNITVLIHYPNKIADDYNPDLMGGLKNAWNVLVASRYSNASNFEFKPISGWQSIEFAEADCVERATGKTVHVVLFKYNYSGGSGKYMEFITPDKSTYEKEFGVYHNDTGGWEKVEKMMNYNKFAVAAADLKGKWTNNFTGLTQYVNAYTGASAGADTHASNQTYEFTPGNTYKWNIAVASGFIGNIKFQGAKSTGKFSVPNNWQINFSDIEGKPKAFNAYFTCIKGARILWIDGTGFGKTE